MESNHEIIDAVAKGKGVYLSTSQSCMCAIALCRNDLLPKLFSARDAWRRIDAEQMQSIFDYNNVEVAHHG